jgi:hypothetical protein
VQEKYKLFTILTHLSKYKTLLQQSAAAYVPNLGFNWQDNPIYQTMPAPYIWYEPSQLSGWTAQPGQLYNRGTLQPATFGNPPFYLVEANTWTPPGGGSAQYMIDDSTDIESENDPLEIAPASDYTSGVTLVAMMKNTISGAGGAFVYVGVGGVCFTFIGPGPGSIAPGIYPSGDLCFNTSGISNSISSTNFKCYIATFQEVNVLGTLLTRIQLYSNGTLITTGDLGYSMSSNAAAKDVQIFGGNRFDIGSILRFNYILDQTQVTTVTNYMRTIWGTLG